MSIEPGLVRLLVAAVLLLVVLNVAVLLVAVMRRGRNREDTSLPLERISTRLDQLERISGNLDDLSRLFLVPHARGGIGETLLYELLKTWLPDRSYQTQYRFTDGSRADAVIRVGDYLVSVDAKFPLDQVRSLLETGQSNELPAKVRRVFAKHIEDIATKYVRPTEGTLEFALMYIPSEAIYYRAFVEGEGTLMESAVRSGVVPVGPSSLFLYLQTVAFGLRGLELSRSARELADMIHQVSHDFAEIARVVDTTTSHVRNAQRNADELSALTRRFADVLDRLANVGGGGT